MSLNQGSEVHLESVNRCLVIEKLGIPPVFIYTRLAYRQKLPYHLAVKAVFVELPPFERHRADYLDDDAFLRLSGY